MRIVLDLATSWYWQRPPVGIVRTERKFAEFLLARRDVRAAFCRYDHTTGRHVAIDAAAVSALLTRGARPVAPSVVTDATFGPSSLESLRTLSTRAKTMLKRSARWSVGRLPEELRPDAVQALRAGVAVLRKSLGATHGNAMPGRRRTARHAQTASPTLAAPSEGQEVFRFEDEDVYVSMGLDWEYNNLAEVQRERRRIGFRTILCCYDTIPVRFPHLMEFDTRELFTRYFVDVAHAADRVVAISETSRRDFLSLMQETGTPPPPVDVVHLGTDLKVPESSVRPPLARLESTPFVLCVGTLEARKNHEVLYHTWDRLIERHGDAVPPLVLVGMIGWGVSDLLSKIRINPRLSGRVLILDNVADGELAWLYRHCLFTVLPSLYEGWGLPVVESLALGKVCICSTAPAVAEAAQGLAIALDPLDTPAWVVSVEQLWLDDAARRRREDQLRREFRIQEWRTHGEQMLAVADEALKAGGSHAGA